MMTRRLLTAAILLVAACHARETVAPPPPSRPSILLVTLDTTRADAIGPEAKGIETPSFNALAARGVRFRYAYTTVPQTLPAHASLLTGAYPAGHGIHENARYLGHDIVPLAERLHAAGYRTAAYVSAFALAKQFGLSRGFEIYDDAFGEGRAERRAAETTDRAVEYLKKRSSQPLFLWVHYYDPHYPYAPPEPFASKYARDPYRGEVAYMDQQLGRLVQAFESSAPGPRAIVLVGDHGEGLGEHGEAQHGNLLYQSTMHVPLVLVGPGCSPAAKDTPVSTRHVFHTILDWAGIDRTQSLRGSGAEVLLGEAMKPFLDYGWQPQVMAVDGRQKVIYAGKLEVYDVVADPAESHDLASSGAVSREARKAIRDYPTPSPAAAAVTSAMSEEDRRRLASLGYVGSAAQPVVRTDAPRPRDMAALFEPLDRASALFVREQYAAAIPVMEKILAADPHNLSTELRLAVAYSALGQDAKALAAFERAQQLAPDSADVRNYLAMHYAKGPDWQKAIPLLERVIADDPDRLPAIEALATIRERQGQLADALDLRERVAARKTLSAPEWVHIGELAMNLGNTPAALDAFEKARALDGAAFQHDLELGVLYLAAGKLTDARDALDRVKPGPAYPMALFKRAQVSVLLHEPDAAARIAAAREHADGTTRALIERERLFR